MISKIANCGCLVIIAFACVVAYQIYVGEQDRELERKQRAERGEKEPEPDPNSPPPADLVIYQFRRADRDWLRKKFGPNATLGKSTTPRVGNHRDGWFYLHEFAGTDEMGRPVNSFSGFLYRTNDAVNYLYYDAETLPDVLPEVTVNGKKIKQFQAFAREQ